MKVREAFDEHRTFNGIHLHKDGKQTLLSRAKALEDYAECECKIEEIEDYDGDDERGRPITLIFRYLDIYVGEEVKKMGAKMWDTDVRLALSVKDLTNLGYKEQPREEDILCDIYNLIEKYGKTLHTISLEDFNNEYNLGLNVENITTWEDLSDELDRVSDSNLWAYPMDEKEYCEEEHKNVVEVVLPSGEHALAEVPEEQQ